MKKNSKFFYFFRFYRFFSIFDFMWFLMIICNNFLLSKWALPACTRRSSWVEYGQFAHPHSSYRRGWLFLVYVSCSIVANYENRYFGPKIFKTYRNTLSVVSFWSSLWDTQRCYAWTSWNTVQNNIKRE